MFLIKRLVTISVVLYAFLSHLEAVQVTTEFYPAGNIPKEYDVSDGADCTVIFLEGLPKNSTISISRHCLLMGKMKGDRVKLGEINDFALGVSALGFIPGVPVSFTFKNSRNSINEKIVLVPNRIFAKSSKDNAMVEAKLTVVNPAGYLIALEGFTEGEEILMRSVSYDEVIEHKFQFDKPISLMLTPGVLGKEGGIGRVTFVRSSGESLKLDLPWGLKWIEYLKYYDKDGSVKTFKEGKAWKNDPKIAEYFNAKS